MKSFLLLAASAILLYSCNYIRGEKVRGNGNLITQDRNPGNFSGVKASGSFDVHITSGANQLKIEAEDNILPYIETVVENNTLKISTKDGYWLQPKRDVTIYVAAPNFHSVEVHGSGNIIGDNTINSNNSLNVSIDGSGDIRMAVHSPNVHARISGSGNIRLSGETTVFDSEIHGSGDIRAFDMKASESKVEIGGSGSAEVVAENKLNVEVNGSGDVRYKGNPQVSSNIRGSGSVVRRD
jgi:hypothetical protein